MTRQGLLHWFRIAAFAGIYFVTARFGLMLDAVSGFATLVWAPTGIALAVLFLLGGRMWPGVAIGALLANVASGAPLAVATGIAFGNTLEAVAGAFALRRVGDFRPSLDRVRDVVVLVALPAMLSTLLSATIGTGSLVLGGIVDLSHLGATWRAWWIGDVIADLVVAPLVLVWFSGRPTIRVEQRWIEVITLATATLVLSVSIFGAPPQDSPFAWRQPYLLFPVLSWASLRAGQRGTTAALFTVAALAIWGTIDGLGPFVRPTLVAGLFSLQIFMAVVAAMFLTLAAATTERLAIARDLQEAVRARDAFLSIASHELRTPLSALQLQVDLLARSEPRADARAKQRVDRIARQVGRLRRLIDDLLDVSRITVGSLHLELEPLELNEVVQEAVARHAAEARRAGVAIGFQPDRQTIWGLWDRGRLEQILDNLLSNALKYGAGAPIEIRLDAEQATARITVTDHGIGIPAEHQARIFERFERLVSSKSYGGLGLGLWIVREIVTALGGRIRVTSRVDAGTTFLVELPCSTREEAVAKAVSSVPPAKTA